MKKSSLEAPQNPTIKLAQKSDLLKNGREGLIKPSAGFIASLLEGLPCQYFSVYFYPERDIFYDPEYYEPGYGLSLLNYKLTDEELLTNYPMSWLKEYFDKEIILIDPVLVKGCHKLQPFCWGYINSDLPAIPLDQNLNHVLKYSTEYDIVKGLTIPLALGRQCYGVFTVTFNPDYNFNDHQIFSLGAFLQSLGFYLLSYEKSTPLKPLDPLYQEKLIESLAVLETQVKLLRRLF
ncbi:autoinducer binding domain-containing protein [Candidatus Odyssella thessalonicensis]|uniref:autoinducer binding domain-containing protein n=1 Tax=Candidatus Odyssella thessalonicensis TaxID=84647 RepID=UPI000225B946|nr:autoinducer binding domain-containing protein [Candidatus Odyssella thessalonicensis]